MVERVKGIRGSVYDWYKKPIKGYADELKRIDRGLYFVWNKYLRKWDVRQAIGRRDRLVGHYESEAKAVEDARIKKWYVDNFNIDAWELKEKELRRLAEERFQKAFEDITGDEEERAMFNAGILEPKPYVKFGE